MSELVVEGLRASVGGFEILRGVDLTVASGEVHVIMGPNGSGKSTLSHVLLGRGDYEVTAGSVTLDGEDLLALPTWQRAARGLLLAMQYPVAVPGVPVGDLVAAAVRAAGGDEAAAAARVAAEAVRLGVGAEFLTRGVNDEFSGGEQKRMETLQLAVLEPRIAILDEIDSGLDVDALRVVARRVEELTESHGLGVLAVTHYARLLEELRADRIHVMMGGRIVATGGPELAESLEGTGYAGLASELGVEEISLVRPSAPDPFAEPGF